VTGPTAQAMIAKLMTERPVHLRVVRPSVPEAIDAAVAKALDKTPADRFTSAGEFARALDTRTASSAALDAVTMPVPSAAVPARRRGLIVGGLAAVAAVAVALGMLATRKKDAEPRVTPLALRDRTQITFTGNVFASAISADGKQLAFITHNCSEKGCSYAVDVQDVGGTATHRIMDGASAGYGLEWSPDRRNLLFAGTLDRRWGVYLLSALGGTPRFLTSAAAMFYAGGDSLLIAPQVGHKDSVFQVQVTSLEGTVRDSIRVAGLGSGISGLSVSPGGKWIVALIVQNGRGLWQVFDRNGTVADRVVNSCTCPGRITGDALWLTRSGVGFESIVRLAIDPATGKLAQHQDTLLSGTFNNFSVTADGTTLVVDDGTADFKLWAVSEPEALSGKFTGEPLLKSSTGINGQISPDGERILVRRNLPTPSGRTEPRFSTLAFAGGTERTLEAKGTPRGAFWVDSVTVAIGGQGGAGSFLSLIDARTGAAGRSLELADSLVPSVTVLPDGWAWIPASADRVMVQRGGKTSEIAAPKWFGSIHRVEADGAGRRLVMTGWNAASFDSLGVAVVPVEGGTPQIWARLPAEQGVAGFVDDGSVVFGPWDTPESIEFFRLSGPGQVQRLGKVPRSVTNVTLSKDLKRAVVLEVSRHGDAFMSKLVRP